PADLDMHCSCPDWEVPCKHLAAVCYVLAEEFDRDPFGMLAWRGKAREELLTSLRAIQGGGSGSGRVSAGQGGPGQGGPEASSARTTPTVLESLPNERPPRGCSPLDDADPIVVAYCRDWPISERVEYTDGERFVSERLDLCECGPLETRHFVVESQVAAEYVA